MLGKFEKFQGMYEVFSAFATQEFISFKKLTGSLSKLKGLKSEI